MDDDQQESQNQIQQEPVFDDAFVDQHFFVDEQDVAHNFYKKRATSLQKALHYSKNLPQSQEFSSILNAPKLLQPLQLPKTLIDIIQKDLEFPGLKQIEVPPIVMRKCDKYHEERERALRVIREKLIKQMSEKAKQVREKATRKTKEVKFESELRSRRKYEGMSGMSETQSSFRKQKQQKKEQIVKVDSEEDIEVQELQKQLMEDGQTGLAETDVFILKNVLEVLPEKCFDKKLKSDPLDMDEREIHQMLLSYRSKNIPRLKAIRKSQSTINLTKQTNLTKLNALKQSDMLKKFFEEQKRLNQGEEFKKQKKKQNVNSRSNITTGISGARSFSQRGKGYEDDSHYNWSFYGKSIPLNTQSSNLFDQMQPDLKSRMYKQMNSSQSMFLGGSINHQPNILKIEQLNNRYDLTKIRERAKNLESKFIQDLRSLKQRFKERSFILSISSMNHNQQSQFLKQNKK